VYEYRDQIFSSCLGDEVDSGIGYGRLWDMCWSRLWTLESTLVEVIVSSGIRFHPVPYTMFL
jgi:hypothetical protein